MDPSGSLWVEILIIIVLTFINAIFAASELAFVSVNQTRIKNLAAEGKRSAQRVLTLLDDPNDFLATIQVVITLAGFLSSGKAATTFVGIVAAWLPPFPGAQTLALVIVTVILAYLSLVLGELFPKQVALQKPERIAMATSGMIMFLQTLLKPFVFLLSASTHLLERITPIDFTEQTEKFTREEMTAIIKESRQEGSIDLDEYSMLQGVLSLDDVMGREVMVPRTDAVMIDINDNFDENLEILLSTTYSRIPLYEDDKDNVIGIIHIKQLLHSAREHGFQNIDLRNLASPPLFVPSTIYIDDLLIEFRREQQHMAILKDEYGGVEGLVTMEDVLEEIVGEIDDESDFKSSDEIAPIEPGHYYLNGLLSIDKFNDYFDLDVESEDVDTIAGLIIYHIGYVPNDNERISLRCGQYVLTTTEIDNGRIRSIDLIADPDHNLETLYDLDEDEENNNTKAAEYLEKKNKKDAEGKKLSTSA